MEREAVSRRSILAMTLVCEGGLGLIALAVGWFLSRPPQVQIAWTATAVGQGLLATLPMFVALGIMTRWPIGPLRSLDELVRRMVVPMFRNCTTLDLLWISAAAGIGEELLFRGVVQTGIEQFSGNTWLAIVVAGAIFGLAHPISTTYAVLAAVIGVYLGWLLVATGNLLTPIVTHAAYDFIALVYLLRQGDPTVSAGEASEVVEVVDADGAEP